jgi:hypothetical protein
MKNHILTDKLNLLFDQQDTYIDYEGLTVTFHKNKGATQQELDSVISTEKLKIPQDYIDFLQVFNGCTLFKYQDLGGFEFLGTMNILKETDIQKQAYEEDWDNDILVFCRLIGDGDFISFKSNNNNSYDILDCYHDDKPQNWKVISNSFSDFLKRLIDGKGKRYWL